MAARTFADWTVENSSTTGTGTYGLAGAPSGTSYFTFRQQYDDGETNVTYWVTNAAGTKWEKNQGGTLTYGTPDTLSRNVVESTNSDAAVPWVAGDAPLLIYVSPDSDVPEGVVTGWLASARHALQRFGHWFKQDDPSSGKHAWKIFDGTNDIQVGIVDTSDSTMVLDPSLSAWRQIDQASPSAASTVDFTDIPDTVNHLMCVFELDPSTDGANLSIQTYDADGNLDTGASDYRYLHTGINSTPSGTIAVTSLAASILLASSADNGNFGIGGFFTAPNIQAATHTKFLYQVTQLDSAGSLMAYINGAGARFDPARITGIRFLLSGGTMTGKITLYASV